MAYKNLLVPLDGSDIGEKALPYAKTIAKLKKSNVILFAVSLKIFADRRDRLFKSYLDVKAKELNSEGIKTSAATSYGDVAEEILRYANNNKIDLIVMATHGYSGAKKWMFGSIAQKVLYGTAIPVLLIKSKSLETSGEFKKILVPIDGSPFSESTFPYVEELTKKTKREILFIHICEPPVVPSYGSKPINPSWKKHRDEMWEETAKLSTVYLDKITATFKSKGLKVSSKVVKAQTGEVAQTIARISKEENIDLMVLATQGRAGIKRWVYGSVANKVVEEFPGPLLLIRPPASIPTTPSKNLLDDIWNGYLAKKM